MLPSDVGRIGSSERGIVEHSIHGIVSCVPIVSQPTI
jgi:hypothetical protein